MASIHCAQTPADISWLLGNGNGLILSYKHPTWIGLGQTWLQCIHHNNTDVYSTPCHMVHGPRIGSRCHMVVMAQWRRDPPQYNLILPVQ